jgi:hypothetical protein
MNGQFRFVGIVNTENFAVVFQTIFTAVRLTASPPPLSELWRASFARSVTLRFFLLAQKKIYE